MLNGGRAAIILTAALGLAAVCGDPKPADEQGAAAGSQYEPQGQVTKLRLEVVEDSITCDGKTHEVRVWLDDLPREPVLSPEVAAQLASRGIPPEPPRGTGVSAFQFKLRYDPAVVWVASTDGAALAAGLDDAAPASAIDRNFTAVAKLDNYEGYAFTGGVALGLTGAVSADQVPPTGLEMPAGIDPAAGDAPIHLMTIALSPIGAGTTELTLDEAQLFTSDSSYSYAPVETAGASITVGGDCAKVDTPTPYPSETALPNPPTEVPPPAPMTLTSSPALGSRSDCNPTWQVATFEGLELCFPEGFAAAGRSPQGIYAALLSLTDPDRGMHLAVSRVGETPVSSGALSTTGEFCESLSSAHNIPFTLEQFSLGEVLADVCVGNGDTGEGGVSPLEGFAALLSGDYLRISVTFNTEGYIELAREILGTLRVE